MAQLDRMQRYSDESPKTPKAHSSSPTFEQLLQGNSPSWYSDSGNSSPVHGKNLAVEEDMPHHNKKSVLSRVKDKAKKLRDNLSGKKKQEDLVGNTTPQLDGNTKPSCGVSLDDDEEEDEDPEYLGAPMYESEQAPEAYKETARQHPRAVPVVSEKRVVPNRIRYESDTDKSTPSKTLTEAVSKKLAPAYAAVSEVTHTIASTLGNLKISSPKQQEYTTHSPVAPSVEHSAATDSKHLNQKLEVHSDQIVNVPGKCDKGISMTEYFMQKLVPGDSDRALSQVLCDALSPASRTHVAPVDNVKISPQSSFSSARTNLSSSVPIYSSPSSSPLIPISTNPHEAAEEENVARVLQAN